MVRHAVLALAILLTALAAAQAAQAQGAGRGLVPMPPVAHPGNPHPGNHQPGNHQPGNLHPGNHHPFHHYGFKGQPFMPYWGMRVYAPPVRYASYASYDAAPVYAPAPVYRPPVSMELGLPPMPSVIPYPNGRYVLMGDGLTSSYRWVWIPDPPAAPPAAPETSPAPITPEPAGPPAAHGGPLYRWVDDQDVVHFTQGWDAVPERYRAQVKLAGAP
jgi:hypothetical protein